MLWNRDGKAFKEYYPYPNSSAEIIFSPDSKNLIAYYPNIGKFLLLWNFELDTKTLISSI